MAVRTDESEAAALQNGADAGSDKHQRIIERAIDLFYELGYDNVRVNDITDSLGIGKGTFYLYFENKHALLLACFKRMEEIILDLETRDAMQHGDFFTKAAPRVRGVLDQGGRWAELMNLLRISAASPDPEIAAKARESYTAIIKPLKSDLQKAMMEGLARDIDAELAIYGWVGMAENMTWRATLDDSYDQTTVIAALVDFTEQGFRRFSPAEPCDCLVKPVQGVIIDRNGTRINTTKIAFGGARHIPGSVGQATIAVDPARVSLLNVTVHEDECHAEITLNDGTTEILGVDGDLVVSGETTLGSVRITLRDIRSISLEFEADPPWPAEP